MTLFNVWHYVVFFVIFLIFSAGVIGAIKQKNKKMMFGMLISISIVSIFSAVFSVVVVDKYTKTVKLYKLKNKRLLSTEQIVYTGVVKNEGNYKIGKVTFEIKLVNKGHVSGNVKAGNFYKASGFLNFFKGGYNLNFKPQTVIKKFVVAKNLKAGAAQTFRVYFRYPPYFRSTSQFSKVWGH